MKNKMELKKCLFRAGLFFLGILILSGVLHGWEFHQYQQLYNEKISSLLSFVEKEYGEVNGEELFRVLNGKESDGGAFLQKHGYDLSKDSAINGADSLFYVHFSIGMLLLLFLFLGVLLHFLRYNAKKDQALTQITKYLEEINKSNYRLEIDTMSEDELSMLKSELYKTTVMLKEVAEQSKKDKENLKQSLSDISHQLKTPLTSMLVLLDNLIEEPDMEEETRVKFVRTIKREIGNMQFLIQSLLKMSKLDAGTVDFFRGNVDLKRIAQAATENVSVLSEIRNVIIETEFCEDTEIFCDYRWQLEAVTNILKNGVEHAPEGSSVLVKTICNPIYAGISIRDYGPGMDEEDRKHIFERFYRGKNAGKDSVGIGLSLAKTIVEQDNGKIFVKSHKEGTKFVVKYFCKSPEVPDGHVPGL